MSPALATVVAKSAVDSSAQASIVRDIDRADMTGLPLGLGWEKPYGTQRCVT
jgi:hypothetical protein